MLNYNHQSEPNPAKLIESLRHLGYDYVDAIADIVDNSIDAEANSITVRVENHQNQIRILVIDDGKGMNEAILGQAIRLGSLVDKDHQSDLGRFGMGLCTASLSLARRTRVITKMKNGALLEAINDIDVVIKENAFKSYLGPATTDAAELFKQYLGGQESGTIIIMENCDKLSNRNTSAVEGRLGKEFSRIFRVFLQSNKLIYVRDQRLAAHDPLHLDDKNTQKWDDTTLDIPYVTPEGKKVTESIRVRLVIIPESPSMGDHERGVNQSHQGFYVMRNNREVADALTLDLYTRHNSLNRMRGEIWFSGKLDHLFGINFMKKRVVLDQAVLDKLKAHIKSQITSIGNQLKRSQRAETPDEVSETHEEARNEIRKKAKLLLTPSAPKEKRQSHDSKDSAGQRDKSDANRTREPSADRSQPGATADVRFEHATLGRQGVIYETDQQGRTVIIRLNIEHPFYARFILEHGLQDKRLLAGMDFMIYCMAVTELRLAEETEDGRRMMDTFKSTLSSNLNTLLS